MDKNTVTVIMLASGLIMFKLTDTDMNVCSIRYW